MWLITFLFKGSGRDQEPGADRGALRGVEKALEREREPREPERNHRSSTTRAVAGATSGRLREPMSAATASPVGEYKTIRESLLATVTKRFVLLFFGLSFVWFDCHFDGMDFHLCACIALCWHLLPCVCLTPPLFKL